MSAVLPDFLLEAQELVTPLLRDAVARLAPPIRRVVDYHMGWADRSGAPVEARGSKSIRPALALLSARAGGGDQHAALPGAVAVECLHNFSFLHDDVMDGDRYRRQRETAWVVFGTPLAICAGDALLTLAQRVLVESEGPHLLRGLELVQKTAGDMIDGQADDLVLEPTRDFDVERWLRMATLKTGALLACSTAVGAALAGAEDELIEDLHGFGRSLGIAFQAVDDVLGVWGRPEQTGGRPVGFDLRARQATLPVAVALQGGGAAAGELEEILARDLDDDDVERATRLIDESGGRERTMEVARAHLDSARDLLEELGIPDDVRRRFVEVASVGIEKGF